MRLISNVGILKSYYNARSKGDTRRMLIKEPYVFGLLALYCSFVLIGTEIMSGELKKQSENSDKQSKYYEKQPTYKKKSKMDKMGICVKLLLCSYIILVGAIIRKYILTVRQWAWYCQLLSL